LIAKQAPHGAAKVGGAAAVGCVGALTGTAGGTVTAYPAAVRRCHYERHRHGVGNRTRTGQHRDLGTILTGWNAAGRPTYCLGLVDLIVFASMLPPILVAAPIGVRTGRLFSQKTLAYGFAIMLFVMAADLILKLVK